MEENEMKNVHKLCLYCFDTLVDHLKGSKSDLLFPDEFKGV
jgi:hypothetical protein